MSELLRNSGLAEWFKPEDAWMFVRAGITLVIGLLLARLLSMALGKAASTRLTRQSSIVARRMSFYLLFALALASTLHQLGFNLSVLLGAAGVLTVAVGFASQTSASNLISGLFLIAERPFVLGDAIRIGDLTGEVLSIDLLSVKLRTYDNLYVRVPNEELIKTRITNLTHFPVRRLDIKVGVAYREDLTKVRELLMAVADRNPLSLDEPPPLLIFDSFADSAQQLQFSVWALRKNFLPLKNSIYPEIKRAFDEAGIEIPFPHVSLYSGSETAPFPVRLADPPGAEHPPGN